MIFPPLAMIAPTSGLGDVSPLALFAKRNAPRINCSSLGILERSQKDQLRVAQG